LFVEPGWANGYPRDVASNPPQSGTFGSGAGG
jgi:hypothetical protein